MTTIRDLTDLYNLLYPAEIPKLDEQFLSYKSAISAIGRYISDGVPPGGQVLAVLRNDLREAFACADHVRQTVIFAIVAYCHNEIPSAAWGSPERVSNWLQQHAERRAAKEDA